MAFKVLDEEQIALLTDDKKRQYEDALDLYNERAAFVERMSTLESVEILSYEPKLQGIAVIDEIPENDYAAPEYTVKRCVQAASPQPQFREFALGEPISAELPLHSKAAQIEVSHIKKAKTAHPKLPEIAKVENITVRADFAEREQPGIPDIAAPNVLTVSFAGPKKVEAVLPEAAVGCASVKEYKTPELIQRPVPEIAVGYADIKEYKTPELIQRPVPEIAVGYADIKEYKTPELTQKPMPKVVKPDFAVRSEKMEPVHAKLPELPGVEPVDVKFIKPEMSDTGISAVSIPSVPKHEFISVECSVSGLPIVREIGTGVREFRSFEHGKNNRKTELPKVEKISVADVVFQPVKAAAARITAAPVAPVRVRPFTKVEGRAKEIPGMAAVAIPDARERLRELLFAEECESLEEAGS